MAKYPVLYDRNMKHKGIVYAESLSASLTARPMSVANMVVPDSVDVQMRDFVQIFFPDGTWQFFRVKTIANEIGGLLTVQMEHGIVWAEDYILPEKQDDLTDTPANVLARFFARLTDTKWRLGTVEPTERIDVQYDHPNVMQGIMDVLGHCKGYTYQFDQSGELWYVNMVALPSEVGCEGRISRNLLTAPVINYNDQEQCTRVYIPGKSWHIDADNIAEVGVIERTINVDIVGVDDDELKEQCRQYLEEHKKPAVSITVDAQELASMTGEPFDRFVEGTICRLCLMDYGGVVIQERISTRIYPDLLGAPEYVQVQIASQLPDVSSQINDITVAQHKIKTSLNDVYSGIVEVDGRLTSVYNEVGLRLDAQAAEIELKASSVQVNAVDQRVNDVSLEIDGLNAEIALKAYSDDVADDLEALSSEMTVAADGIRAQIQAGDKVVSELAVTVEGLENWTTDSAGNISELTNTVRGMESKVTTVDGKVATLTNTADGLTSTIQQQGMTLSELKTRSDEISANVQDVEGNIGALTVTSNSVAAKVKNTENKVATLVLTADGLTNNITDQSQVLASFTTRIDEIASMVTDGNDKTAQLIVMADRITQKVEDVSVGMAQFTVMVDEISAEVTNLETDTNARFSVMSNNISSKVSRGSVISEINQSAESVRISAAKINLEGYVTASQLDAKFADFDTVVGDFDVMGGVGVGGMLHAGGLAVDNPSISVGDTNASWKELEVVTGAGLSVSKANTPPFYGRENELLSNGVSYVSSVTLNVTRGTIHYLGY